MMEMAPEFFVGREKQLALVGNLLGAPWGSRRVLLIHGPGGIGKTRLLQEIRKRQEEYAHILGGPFVFTEILDFDYWCAGGCPLMAYRATGRYDARSPYCAIYRTLYPEVIRLEGLRLLKDENNKADR